MTGNPARHLQTLAALISGIIRSKSCQLPALASEVPALASEVPNSASPKGGKHESRSKRFARFLQNKRVTPEEEVFPYAQALVESLPPGPLVLIMDGSQIGRGCMALMLSVLCEHEGPHGDQRQGRRKRALPLCWQVVRAKKGHFPQESHQGRLDRVRQIVPPHRVVILLGDGEFDGPDLLADVTAAGWCYVCRTTKSVFLAEADWPEETFTLARMRYGSRLRTSRSCW